MNGQSSKPTDEADPPAPRVLIVEDDPDQRGMICETLREHFGQGQAHLVAVATGRECLSQDLDRFDIVLLDHNLPDTTGMKLLETILAEHDLPAVFVTGENAASIAAEAIRCGAQDYVVKAGDYLFALPVIIEKNLRLHRIKQDNALLQTKLTATLEEIRVKNAQLEETLQKVAEMAATDHLTALANRRVFAQTLEHSFDEALRYGFDLCCAMCDVDNFKRLNDVLGHQAGDRVLVATAEAIRANIRASDTAARYGGDEFVILFAHASAEMAIRAAQRICQHLNEATRQFTRTGAGETLSVGIASLLSDRPASATALVAMADRALCVAKARGKDCIVRFADCQLSGEPTAI